MSAEHLVGCDPEAGALVTGESLGLRFGHHLGLPAALTALPAAPLIPRYADLLNAQRAAGFRYAGEVLVCGGTTHFRVLDGVFVPGRGRTWQRVDGRVLHRLDHGGRAGALIARLAEIQDSGPALLRRVLLYQLLGLLAELGRRPVEEDAVALGVDTAEAGALARAAYGHPVPTAAQRAAAESLPDAWEERRLFRAGQLADRLSPAARQDPWVARRVRESAAVAGSADRERDAARRQERSGDVEAAAAGYLRAARLVCDDPRTLHGLLRTHTSADGLGTELTAGSVRLSWPAGTDAAAGWRVYRIPADPGPSSAAAAPDEVTEVAVSVTARYAEDRQAPLGSAVRYAVVPVRDGSPDGPARVSPRLLIAPEPTELRLDDGRGRVTASWRPPPGAAGVLVTRTGPDGQSQPVTPEGDGFRARDLPPGDHRFHLRCRYRTTGGSEVHSPGIQVRRTVHHWPEPVTALTATPGTTDGSVLFRWRGGGDGEVRLVEWPGQPPAEGSELSVPAADLPGALAWPRADPPASCFIPPPGTVTAVTALATLGGRTVIGPGVRIAAPHPVSGLRAERAAGGPARVTFDWPPDAGLVTVVCESGGQVTEHRVTRSRYLREGLRMPVPPGGVRLGAAPDVPQTEAVVIPPPLASYVLPPDIAIVYRVLPGPRRPLRRGPATVEVSLSLPDGDHGADLPEFVLVARPGTARSVLRPRDPADGTTVLRLSGAQLRRSGRIACEIAPGACRPPYALRGFLLGSHAAAVRLEEPSPTTLVMR